MKTSEINDYIDFALINIFKNNIPLPELATINPEKIDWKLDEINDCNIGWDVTDFGLGDFEKYGRIIFTLRNGNGSSECKSYCEKIICGIANQSAPPHYHKKKTEDIINKGGGTMCIKMWKSGENGEKTDESFTVSVDSIPVNIELNDFLVLSPGNSITINPGIIHQFWGTTDYTVLGEISNVCDDENDNFFVNDDVKRFPEIEVDEKCRYFLCKSLRDRMK
jgi:D-lyxose ketol-isomerase